MRLTQTDIPHYFSPEELKEYDKLRPGFSKKYLDDILDVRTENKKNDQRAFILAHQSILITLLVVIFLMAVVGYCLWKEQYRAAIMVCGGALGTVVVALIKSK